jgi:hypothetical protein
VKGSPGRITDEPDHSPLVISGAPDLLPDGPIDATAFKDWSSTMSSAADP